MVINGLIGETKAGTSSHQNGGLRRQDHPGDRVGDRPGRGDCHRRGQRRGQGRHPQLFQEPRRSRGRGRSVRQAGAEAGIVQGDVAEEADCRKIAEVAPAWPPRCAGQQAASPSTYNHAKLDALSKEDFLNLYAVNTVGGSRCCALPPRRRPPSAERADDLLDRGRHRGRLVRRLRRVQGALDTMVLSRRRWLRRSALTPCPATSTRAGSGACSAREGRPRARERGEVGAGCRPCGAARHRRRSVVPHLRRGAAPHWRDVAGRRRHAPRLCATGRGKVAPAKAHVERRYFATRVRRGSARRRSG